MAEAFIRFSFFIGLLLLFSILESIYPRRGRVHPRKFRWPNNLGILFTGSVLSRVVPSLLPLSAAVMAAQQDFGLFHTTAIPVWAAFVLTILLLDLIIYWQHRILHTVPVLARIHRMHHTDRDIDATTALRFHPLEMLLSMVIKSAAVWMLGAPAPAVLVFEIILNGTAMFNHANLFIPRGIDVELRRMLVTPDMHRIHHSVRKTERNSNYGFALSWWDRLFRSYTAEPAEGYDGMGIGIRGYEDSSHQVLHWMLASPFLSQEKPFRED